MRATETAGNRHALLIAGAVATLTTPLLLLLFTGRILARDDLGSLHLPFRYLYQEALTGGRLLLWTPAYHSGFFLYGAGEAGMLHPLHLALYRVLPLAGAFNLEIIASYLSLFCGTTLLARRLGLSIESALFGAMTFAFCGFTLFNLMHVNHIGTFAHSPWMLLAALQLTVAVTGRQLALAFGGLAIATGLQMLAGNPQYVWLTSIALAYLVGCRLISGTERRALALIIAALAAGLGIGAVQLLPTLDFLSTSTRAAWSADTAMTFSLSPLNLIQLWSPFAFEFRVAAPPAEQFIVHEFIVYNGAFCSAALVWAAMRRRSIRHRGLLVACAIFAAINLLLAFGRHGGIYPWLAALPGVGAFRAPSRHLLLVQWAMSGIAAIAFEDLRQLSLDNARVAWRHLLPLFALAGLAIATTAAAALMANSPWAMAQELRFSGVMRSAPWALIVVAVIALVMLIARGHRWAITALICLSALDLGLWGYSYLFRWGAIETPSVLAAGAPAPPEAVAGDLIPTVDGGPSEYAILRGLRLTDGYTGLYASAQLNPRDPAAQRVAGVNWRYDSGRWTRTANALPRGRLITASVVAANPAEQLAQIDPASTALVDHPLTLSGTSGIARIVEEHPGYFEIETTSDGSQLLVMTEKFHHGWQALIDGNPSPTIRAYGDFLACQVPAGSHRVDLIFMPRSFVAGGWITAGSLLGVLAVSAWLWRRPRSLAPAAT